MLQACCQKSIAEDLIATQKSTEIFYNSFKHFARSNPDPELDLILDMIQPTARNRPNINAIKKRWNHIFPRAETAKVYLIRLFDHEVL